jgi:hypothetical protein
MMLRYFRWDREKEVSVRKRKKGVENKGVGRRKLRGMQLESAGLHMLALMKIIQPQEWFRVRRCVWLCLLLVLAMSTLSACRTEPICILNRPAQNPAAHVTDTWIGFTRSDNDLYELTLRPDATGSLVAIYAHEHRVQYAIQSWQLGTGHRLICRFPATQGSHDPHELEGTVSREDTIVATLSNGVGGVEGRHSVQAVKAITRLFTKARSWVCSRR